MEMSPTNDFSSVQLQGNPALRDGGEEIEQLDSRAPPGSGPEYNVSKL